MEEANRPKREFTEAEMELMTTANEEIIERHQVFSFNYDEFKVRVAMGDRWQQLVQGHLYLEHVVSALIEEALPYPDRISLERMGFQQRLKLATAMGLVPFELASAAEVASKLRNGIAHDLNFAISDKDVLDFRNSIPKFLRDAIEAGKDREPGVARFDELILALALQLEILRQKFSADRELTKKAELRLRAAIDGVKVPKA